MSAVIIHIPARRTHGPDTKVRNGLILLHGADVPPALRDEIARLVGTRLNDEPTEFLVSGADSDCYDYFDEECE